MRKREGAMKDKARAYSRERHILALINMVLLPTALSLFLITGVAGYLKYLALEISANEYIDLAVFSGLMSMALYIVTLPANYYGGFALEHKYSLSNQKLSDWIKRELKRLSLTLLISIPFVLSLYMSLKYYPLQWWLVTALTWFFISVLIAKFMPVIIGPLFYKYIPLKNDSLKDRIVKLAEKTGFRARGVYEIDLSKDTKKANAVVMGMGRHKKIVLCDTLLKNFTDDEIELVMGHELGHHKMRHILKLMLFSGGSTILIFYIASIAFLKFHAILNYMLLHDFESLVLIYAIVSILNIFILPLSNAYSRKLEKDADRFALKVTANKPAFISTMKKLAEQNLADTAPGKFYEIMLYDHPPISRRLEFAEKSK